MSHFLRQNATFCGCLLLILAIRLIWSGYLPLMEFSEARYAEMARKMLEYNDWITLWFNREQPFWGKPPLAFWSVASSFAIFGVNEFASRLPSLLFTLGSAFLIYRWVRDELDQATALRTVLVFLSCWLVLHSAGAVITDPTLAFTTTLVMVGFWRGIVNHQPTYIYLMWFSLGLGLLTKGPIALILCGLPCAFWVVANKQWRSFWQHIRLFRGLILMLLVASPWYILAEQKTPGFINYFLVGEHFLRFTETAWAGDLYGGVKDQPHGTIWLYLFAALLPFSPIVLFRGLSRRGRNALRVDLKEKRLLTIYLLAWLLAPAIFFSFAKNILITYVLTGIPAASILIARRTDDWLVPIRWFYRFIITGSLCFLIVYLASYEFYAKNHHYNQKPLVMEYQRLNATNPGPLVYWGAPRFSVVFYTGDQVVFPGPKVSQHYYPEAHYHAVRDMWAHATERAPFSNRCEQKKYHGEYTLWFCPALIEAP